MLVVKSGHLTTIVLVVKSGHLTIVLVVMFGRLSHGVGGQVRTLDYRVGGRVWTLEPWCWRLGPNT